MTTFDPAQFVDMETTEVLTKRPPLPVQDYTAMIGEVTVKPWQSAKDSTKSGLSMIVPLKIQVPQDVKAALNLSVDEITLTDRVFLDTKDDGTLDYSPGRNSGLRKYRDATGLNQPGVPFSMRRMMGQPVKVRLEHELYNGDVQERVGGVAKP